MPFVRHPEYPRFLEERWLFEVISETYLPLLRVFRSLESDSVPFHVTLSVSPTLSAMLGDKTLMERYAEYLESQAKGSALAEEERVGGDPDFGPLARMYRDLYAADKTDFEELYGRDILAALDFYYKKGKVELMTSGATHAFLPIFRDCREGGDIANRDSDNRPPQSLRQASPRLLAAAARLVSRRGRGAPFLQRAIHGRDDQGGDARRADSALRFLRAGRVSRGPRRLHPRRRRDQGGLVRA